MAGSVLDIESFSRDDMAEVISEQWSTWHSQKNLIIAEYKERRNFLFATDTSKTSAGAAGWNNSTVTPKLTQIRDNLHTNYLVALFPNDNWLKWEAYTLDPKAAVKKSNIEGYMQNKVRESGFRDTVSRVLLDYIDWGNAFFEVKYLDQSKPDAENEDETIPQYVGPKLRRISPLDIVFNLAAEDFKSAPKIIREVKSFGEALANAEDMPEDSEYYQAITKAKELRVNAGGWTTEDNDKAEGISIDGYGNYQEYLQSGMIEMLRFVGDYYDKSTGKLLRNQEIVVIDRAFIAIQRQIPSWLDQTVYHVGWRIRPDNLWAMGPLDNLVGMQYRIDHLENMKADLWDLTRTPVMIVTGSVNQVKIEPGETIFLEEGESVDMWSPDVKALSFNQEIDRLMAVMELLAGAPREAMGIRSPGEKTAFEVQTLDNAITKVFTEKTNSFEIVLEGALNGMFESARRNMNTADTIRVFDNDLGTEVFMQITKEDITAKGKLRPIGARHFGQTAKAIQELDRLMAGALGPKLLQNLNTTTLTTFIEDNLGLERFSLFEKDADLYEGAERQQLLSTLQEEAAVQAEGAVDELRG